MEVSGKLHAPAVLDQIRDKQTLVPISWSKSRSVGTKNNSHLTVRPTNSLEK